MLYFFNQKLSAAPADFILKLHGTCGEIQYKQRLRPTSGTAEGFSITADGVRGQSSADMYRYGVK
jgi:hypothetical protein